MNEKTFLNHNEKETKNRKNLNIYAARVNEYSIKLILFFVTNSKTNKIDTWNLHQINIFSYS